MDRVETTLQYFYPDLGFFQQEYQTKEEVLAFLAREIIQKGIAPDHFFELIMEREEIAPTSYGNSIAIPHPLKPITDSTFLSICTLKKPIQWGENKVQLIFLLSVQKKYKKDIQKLYQLLVKISGNAYMVNQLLKVKSFDEFKEFILDLGQWEFMKGKKLGILALNPP
ncbi:PTS sugar transporter subunit IIA, partial [Streptococcus hyovaginalis]